MGQALLTIRKYMISIIYSSFKSYLVSNIILFLYDVKKKIRKDHVSLVLILGGFFLHSNTIHLKEESHVIILHILNLISFSFEVSSTPFQIAYFF